jgi:hypothetical protein
MTSQEQPTRARRLLGQLPSFALFLLAGVLAASFDGFPPSWPALVAAEVAAVAVFLIVDRRERRWHRDLPDRIRRNDEAVRKESAISRPYDDDQGK